MSHPIKVATEVWIATALLHREHLEREDFAVIEIVDRVAQENLAGELRPGVQIHASQHCVANKRPHPNNFRMLYETSRGRRRLFRPGDDFHEYRKSGKRVPGANDVPPQYQYLLEWYEQEYCQLAGHPEEGKRK
ncbi:hypothetical protein MYX84_03630 [Acidobacteria bacterium AH-259-O06]|nr:hypothetical protein [Acidobacteria bacterium AH-259-O06]